eukprot:m.329334 g.329334  ORF g.329334 m.329334 type:complete len:54 (+) comp20445_c0_seq7:651-812(+)
MPLLAISANTFIVTSICVHMCVTEETDVFAIAARFIKSLHALLGIFTGNCAQR